MKYNVHADCDWIQGHTRWGHYEGELTEEEYQEYLSLSDEEKIEYIRDRCALIVDDTELDDCADPTNIQITKI